jgi:RNA polymerase sigma factor (sigma-70 family)
MIKVLIADDHILIREGFKKILDRESDIEVVGESENGPQVLAFLQQQPCDIVVLDITMPVKDGLEVLAELKANYPELKILMLSMHSEERYAVRAIKAGAAGYLTKESAPDELIKAIHQIISGRMYISQPVAEQLALSIARETKQAPHEKLSDREFQILRLLGSGKSVREIGCQLNLSQSTISTYRHRILEKLKLNSTADLIRYALEHQLTD